MKDEEIANKYAEEYRKNFRYYRAWHGQVVDKSPSTIVEQSFKDGFLAGLKAGRPQWHDLRKDPKDLPKEFDINKNKWEMEKRITKHIVQNECGERVFCFNGTWYHEKGGEAHPIAWCEIPTFDKE